MNHDNNEIEYSDMCVVAVVKKRVVIRNCCYYMENLIDEKVFQKIRGNKYIDSTFVWEHFVVKSNTGTKK